MNSNDSLTPDDEPGSTASSQNHQAQLKQQQQEMTGLLYAISHDLRAPLRAISGFSQALHEHAAGALDDTCRHYLQRIEDSARRMSVLLDALLSLSRISQNEMLRLDIDLTRLAQEAANRVASQHPQHHPQLTIAPQMQAYADARLVKQALQCLLDNAWKCTAHRPDAHIEVGRMTQDGQVVYFVRDNGVGFDMRYAGKLFVPFQQLHARTELNGLGIGLALTQRVVARHGGRIWAQASADGGAQFLFTLPSTATTHGEAT